MAATTTSLRERLIAATDAVHAEWADRLQAVAHLSRYTPERRDVEQAYMEARITATDAVRQEVAREERRHLDPGACSKCDGAGRISAFSHVHEGVCFACNGTGRAR